MPFDKTSAIAELNAALGDFEHEKKNYLAIPLSKVGTRSWDLVVAGRVIAKMSAALTRWGPPDYGAVALPARPSGGNPAKYIDSLAGVLYALRNDIEKDRLRPFAERLHSALFADFLGMADYLIEDEGLKDPAAVLAGGVLEEHLRKLCAKSGLDPTFADGKSPIRPKMIAAMNADLTRASVYGSIEQKHIMAWGGIRNDAAHAKYSNYDAQQVKLMIQGIRDFVAKYPA